MTAPSTKSTAAQPAADRPKPKGPGLLAILFAVFVAGVVGAWAFGLLA